MKKNLFFGVLFSVALINFSSSQNLVPNWSFENVSAEPFYGCELTDAVGWLNPCNAACPTNSAGTPDLYSTFSVGQAELPNSFMATTNPHTGNRIAGLVTYHQQLPNYREYISIQLLTALVPGETYTVSFWETGGTSVHYYYHSNNLAVNFSLSALIQNNYDVISSVTPQYKITNIVADTSWTYYSFTLTPTQAYTYIALGNFDNDANTQTQLFGTYRPYAYYFLDDISVVHTCTPPQVNLGNDATVCSPSAVTLDATTSNATYSWNTGATTASVTASSTGEYAVTVSVGGCNSSDSVYITEVPKPIASIGANDENICSGTAATICANTGMSSYLWSTGETSVCINTNSAGNYSVTVTDNHGCTAVSNNETITVFPAPGTGITQSGDTLTSLPAASYQWYLNGNPIPGATSQIYIASQPGNYTVEVMDANGCIAVSNPVIIHCGHGHCHDSALLVYPNPSEGGIWNLDCSGDLIGSEAEILDGGGKVIYKFIVTNQAMQLGLSSDKGIYLLHLHSSSANIYKKLINL